MGRSGSAPWARSRAISSTFPLAAAWSSGVCGRVFAQPSVRPRRASVETRVKLIHPDWSDSEVASEVARINDEKSAAAALTAGPSTPGTFGDDDKDPKATGNFPVTDQTKGPQRRPPPASPPFAKQG